MDDHHCNIFPFIWSFILDLRGCLHDITLYQKALKSAMTTICINDTTILLAVTVIYFMLGQMGDKI